MRPETTEPAMYEPVLLREPAVGINVERSDRRAAVTLSGEVDMLVEADIIRSVTHAASLPGLDGLHIDTSKVTFIDSSGLRSLLLSRQAAIDRGLRFSLAVVDHGAVARLLVLAGLYDELAPEIV